MQRIQPNYQIKRSWYNDEQVRVNGLAVYSVKKLRQTFFHFMLGQMRKLVLELWPHVA